jgi:hypothetical protein
MAKSVRVQFEDGTSHIYDNVPDDVDASQVESRAQDEFGKTVLTAHSPNQGAAPGAVPGPGQGETAPTFAQYSTLPTTAGQIIGAAAIPIQVAAEHPAETAAGLGLYKAGQVANAYIGGKQAEAEAMKQTAALRAQAAAGHQNIQQQKINARINPVAGPVVPSNPAAGLYSGQGTNIPGSAPVTPVAPVAQAAQTAQTAQAAAQPSMVNQIRNKAASMVTGLAQANPMLATAGKYAGKVLPGAGAALGGLEAYNRAQQGDYLGSGLAGVGAAASFVPVVGTGINLATTGINAARDYSKYLDAKRKYEEQQRAMGK